MRRIIVALALVISVAASAQDMTSVFVDAVSLYNSNQYGRSKELLENIIKKEPANDAAYYYLALCEASLKDADSAIAHLKKAV
ncbi:MAG: tetratricopeptide repeat protein, partial [Bacteroidales bacterium]|nr:tetratricopeptide repeat protein [Bacteroidales bacterium]